MAVYTLVAQDNTNVAQKKATGLVNKFSSLIASPLAVVTDGAKTGLLVSTVWSDAKFVFVASDGTTTILTPAEAAAVMALIVATL